MSLNVNNRFMRLLEIQNLNDENVFFTTHNHHNSVNQIDFSSIFQSQRSNQWGFQIFLASSTLHPHKKKLWIMKVFYLHDLHFSAHAYLSHVTCTTLSIFLWSKVKLAFYLLSFLALLPLLLECLLHTQKYKGSAIELLGGKEGARTETGGRKMLFKLIPDKH